MKPAFMGRESQRIPQERVERRTFRPRREEERNN